MGLSLLPSQAVQGGILPEGVYRFTNARAELWDYDGKGQPACGLMVTLTQVGSGQVYDKQFWSCGSPDQVQPNNGGSEVVAVGTSRGLRENCNLIILLDSMKNAGYTEERMGNYAGGDNIPLLFNGMEAWVILQDAPSRGDLQGCNTQNCRHPASLHGDGKNNGVCNSPDCQCQQFRRPQVPVVGEIKVFPWDARPEAKTGTAAAGGQGQSAPSGPASRGRASGPFSAPRGAAATAAVQPELPSPVNGATVDPDAEAAALELVAEVVQEAGGGLVERQVITTAAMRKFGTSPLRQKVMPMLVSQERVQAWAAEGLVVLDGTRIGLPGGSTQRAE